MTGKKQTIIINKVIWLFKQSLTIVTLVLFAMIVFTALSSDYFLSKYNIQALSRELAFNTIMALSMGLLIVVGDFDLSVGKIGSLCGILAGLLMTTAGWEPVYAIVVILILGAILGLLNGLLVTLLKLPAMIVTIGMTSVHAGLIIVLTHGAAVTGLPKNWLFIGQGQVLGMPIPFLIMVGFLLFMTFLMGSTRYGRYSYAVGNNPTAAKILGINNNVVRIIAFVIMGATASAVGMLYVARLGTSQPNIGDSWPLTAIASCVIGGYALTGGEGHPFGALIGAAVMTIVINIIVMLGVSIYWQLAVQGLIIVLAISVDPIQRIIREKRTAKLTAK